MAYKVIEEFVDLKDMNHVYKVGDKFPHDEREVSAERLAELSGSENKRKMPLIAEVKTEKKSEPAPVVEEEKSEDFMNEPVTVEDTEQSEEVKPTRRGRKK